MSREGIDDEQEKEHFKRIVQSFKLYHYHASKRVARSLSFYHEMTERQRDYLRDHEDNCKQLLRCIEHNAELISMVLDNVGVIFENATRTLDDSDDESGVSQQKSASHLSADVDRVYTTLRQIVRDWSAEGAVERESYRMIIDELKALYPNVRSNNTADVISVLVPGAGLARLAFEIARLGFKCEGNEFSLHMLITSHFILNRCQKDNEYTFYPYAHNFCNNVRFQDQVKAVRFPDVSPYNHTDELGQFSMTAGDFLDIYNEKNSWHNVATCFFIDTAHNVIDYVEKIWHILKPGGYWINLGPLLYHFSNISREKSIELSYEQLRNVITAVGFVIRREQLNVNATYLDNKNSMLQYNYNCVYFVAQKPV